MTFDLDEMIFTIDRAKDDLWDGTRREIFFIKLGVHELLHLNDGTTPKDQEQLLFLFH